MFETGNYGPNANPNRPHEGGSPFSHAVNNQYCVTNTTGITVNSGGSGTAMDNRPRSTVVAYWVRVA